MRNGFFLKREDEVFGPYSLDHLRIAAVVGRLNPDDLIAQSETGPWEPARALLPEKTFGTLRVRMSLPSRN